MATLLALFYNKIVIFFSDPVFLVTVERCIWKENLKQLVVVFDFTEHCMVILISNIS